MSAVDKLKKLVVKKDMFVESYTPEEMAEKTHTKLKRKNPDSYTLELEKSSELEVSSKIETATSTPEENMENETKRKLSELSAQSSITSDPNVTKKRGKAILEKVPMNKSLEILKSKMNIPKSAPPAPKLQPGELLLDHDNMDDKGRSWGTRDKDAVKEEKPVESANVGERFGTGKPAVPDKKVTDWLPHARDKEEKVVYAGTPAKLKNKIMNPKKPKPIKPGSEIQDLDRGKTGMRPKDRQKQQYKQEIQRLRAEKGKVTFKDRKEIASKFEPETAMVDGKPLDLENDVYKDTKTGKIIQSRKEALDAIKAGRIARAKESDIPKEDKRRTQAQELRAKTRAASKEPEDDVHTREATEADVAEMKGQEFYNQVLRGKYESSKEAQELIDRARALTAEKRNAKAKKEMANAPRTEDYTPEEMAVLEAKRARDAEETQGQKALKNLHREISKPKMKEYDYNEVRKRYPYEDKDYEEMDNFLEDYIRENGNDASSSLLPLVYRVKIGSGGKMPEEFGPIEDFAPKKDKMGNVIKDEHGQPLIDEHKVPAKGPGKSAKYLAYNKNKRFLNPDAIEGFERHILNKLPKGRDQSLSLPPKYGNERYVLVDEDTGEDVLWNENGGGGPIMSYKPNGEKNYQWSPPGDDSRSEGLEFVLYLNQAMKDGLINPNGRYGIKRVKDASAHEQEQFERNLPTVSYGEKIPEQYQRDTEQGVQRMDPKTPPYDHMEKIREYSGLINVPGGNIMKLLHNKGAVDASGKVGGVEGTNPVAYFVYKDPVRDQYPMFQGHKIMDDEGNIDVIPLPQPIKEFEWEYDPEDNSFRLNPTEYYKVDYADKESEKAYSPENFAEADAEQGRVRHNKRVTGLLKPKGKGLVEDTEEGVVLRDKDRPNKKLAGLKPVVEEEKKSEPTAHKGKKYSAKQKTDKDIENITRAKLVKLKNKGAENKAKKKGNQKLAGLKPKVANKLKRSGKRPEVRGLV